MNKIKELRIKLSLTVYDIAEITGFTPSYISNLENGHKTNPTKGVMTKIAAALGQTVSEVFFSEENQV